jgi:hypothetical protein
VAVKKQTPGRSFEESVYGFSKTLDPSAEVIFNHTTQDRDTGETRQCDVWINAKVAGHWPISILVSCKDHKRKLHVGDIGTFCDEKRSVGASTGIIYSRSGFTRPAVRKAHANGVACCRLYNNEHPDMPTSLWIEHFLCKPTIQLKLSPHPIQSELKTWNDLFELTDQSGKKALDLIAERFAADEKQSLIELQELCRSAASFPPNWSSDIRLSLHEHERKTVLTVIGKWKAFRARSEASLFEGSYCLTNGSFRGTQVGPSIDTWGEHPGEHWEQLHGELSLLPSNGALTILGGSNVSGPLKEKVGPSPINPDRHSLR